MSEPNAGKPQLNAVSVVIPTHNRAQRCARLLSLLAEQTLNPDLFEVVVVDDCSTDDTSAMLERLVPELPFRLRPMRAAENRGAGPARNLGWRSTSAPIIAFIDDDCVPDPKWLESGIRPFAHNARLGIVQGRTVPKDPSAIEELRTSRWLYGIVIEGPNAYFDTCNIFYRRQAIEDAGGFGEEYNRWSSAAWGEDTLAGWSALEAGWEREYVQDAAVTHEVEHRSRTWWIKTSLSQYRLVALAKRFPEYREETFWQPWAPTRGDAAFAFAVVGIAAAARWRPAAVAVLPYLWWRRPSVREPDFFRSCIDTVMVDSARFIGNVYGSARSRTIAV